MRNAITYLLLFTYSTIMFKPLLPYTSDIIAHVFWYSDHIATVHSHSGKFHVHKETTEASKSADNEKNSNVLKRGLTAGEHLINKQQNKAIDQAPSQIFFYGKNSAVVSIYFKVDYPPPRV